MSRSMAMARVRVKVMQVRRPQTQAVVRRQTKPSKRGGRAKDRRAVASRSERKQLRSIRRVMKALGLHVSEATLERIRSREPLLYSKLIKYYERFEVPDEDTDVRYIVFRDDDDYKWYTDYLRNDKNTIVVDNGPAYNRMDRKELVQRLVPAEADDPTRKRLLQEPDMYKLYWLLLSEAFLAVSLEPSARNNLSNYMRRNDSTQRAKFLFVSNKPQEDEEEENEKTRKLIALRDEYRTGDHAHDLAFVKATCNKMAAIVQEFADSEENPRKRKRDD